VVYPQISKTKILVQGWGGVGRTWYRRISKTKILVQGLGGLEERGIGDDSQKECHYMPMDAHF